MFKLKNQYGEELTISNSREFSSFIDAIPSHTWGSGSGDVCLLNDENGFYMSISKMDVENRFIITSAESFGDDLHVYVSSQNYTSTVGFVVGGEPTKFPSEFFVDKKFVHEFGMELIDRGSICFSENWVMLHQQEWPGMADDF